MNQRYSSVADWLISLVQLQMQAAAAQRAEDAINVEITRLKVLRQSACVFSHVAMRCNACVRQEESLVAWRPLPAGLNARLCRPFAERRSVSEHCQPQKS